jgi:cytochrome c peroxidase
MLEKLAVDCSSQHRHRSGHLQFETNHDFRVAGINDVTGMPASFTGTCGTCHDSPNIGHHSVSAPLNIGVADVNSPLDVRYLPVFTLINNASGETVQTTDPGRAVIAGKWADIGKVKGPILRGLAGRALIFTMVLPLRWRMSSSFMTCVQYWVCPSGKADLIAFLNSL